MNVRDRYINKPYIPIKTWESRTKRRFTLIGYAFSAIVASAGTIYFSIGIIRFFLGK